MGSRTRRKSGEMRGFPLTYHALAQKPAQIGGGLAHPLENGGNGPQIEGAARRISVRPASRSTNRYPSPLARSDISPFGSRLLRVRRHAPRPADQSVHGEFCLACGREESKLPLDSINKRAEPCVNPSSSSLSCQPPRLRVASKQTPSALSQAASSVQPLRMQQAATLSQAQHSAVSPAQHATTQACVTKTRQDIRQADNGAAQSVAVASSFPDPDTPRFPSLLARGPFYLPCLVRGASACDAVSKATRVGEI